MRREQFPGDSESPQLIRADVVAKVAVLIEKIRVQKARLVALQSFEDASSLMKMQEALESWVIRANASHEKLLIEQEEIELKNIYEHYRDYFGYKE